ncbi:MAG TPA: LLM class flavin-dependent oxidoreductase [Thermomicrobiales bacterium]|nr:LLM class flavin-dependent oxidoreductase [Thermomicrobiales bacterium]
MAAQRRIEFGISLPNRAVLFGLPIKDLLDTAVDAEATGAFDSVWVGDNFLSKPRLEAIALLSAIAARTERVQLGTICLATFPMRHPLELAIQWASLDVISGGRTNLVVCSGGAANKGPLFATELAAMGVASNERIPRVEEGIELLRKLWGDEPVTHHGRFYTMDEVVALPKPAQPRIPIGIAANPWRSPAFQTSAKEQANEERVLRRVARLADSWQTDSIPPEVLRERWQRIQEYSVEYGRPGAVDEMSLHLMVNINEDVASARQESVEFLTKYYGENAIAPDFLDMWLACGSPEQVAEKIATFVEAGCTTPVLRFTSPDQRGQLERAARDVMPVLRATFA